MIPTPAAAFPAGTVLWVALGGAIGSALRYAISDGVRRLPALTALPWATLTVNIVGSMLLGFVLRWSVSTDASPQLRAFLMIGVCGGFTTFSAFALEGAGMVHANQIGRAATYALVSVALSVGAVFIGYALAFMKG